MECERKCANCEWWQRFENNRNGMGECRNSVPRRLHPKSMRGYWLQTNENEWCCKFNTTVNKG